MKHISETWICNFLRMYFNHSTKVIGMFIWAKTDGGKQPLKISWDDLSESTGTCKHQSRICLDELKRSGLITVEHKYKTPTMTITLVGGKNE